MTKGLVRTFALLAFAGAATALCAAPPASALDKVSAGKAVPEAWTFLPLDVGVQEGIFARYGLDVTIVNFDGDAKLQQGLAAGSVGFGLGSGPSMAFAAKGSPVRAVAAFAGPPKDITIAVRSDSPIRTEDDLKGKTLSSSSPGSLTSWLAKRMAIAHGWGPDGVRLVYLGGLQGSMAALRANTIDGALSSFESGTELEEKGAGRIVGALDKYAPVFITHVVFARQDVIAKDPGLVTRFLKGVFASIAFIKTHKAETARIEEAVIRVSPDVASKTYDHEIGMYETDGRFDPAAVALLKRSFIEMGLTKTEPQDNQLFTAEFVPVTP